jgi:hypothetical protein
VAEACLPLIPFTYFVEIIGGLWIKQTRFIDLAPDCLALTLFAMVFVFVVSPISAKRFNLKTGLFHDSGDLLQKC